MGIDRSFGERVTCSYLTFFSRVGSTVGNWEGVGFGRFRIHHLNLGGPDSR